MEVRGLLSAKRDEGGGFVVTDAESESNGHYDHIGPTGQVREGARGGTKASEGGGGVCRWK